MLARQIAAAENAVRDRAGPGRAGVAAGRLAQFAHLMLVDQPAWDATVLAEVAGFLWDPIWRSVAAARELRAMATQLPTTVRPGKLLSRWEVTRLRTYYARHSGVSACRGPCSPRVAAVEFSAGP